MTDQDTTQPTPMPALLNMHPGNPHGLRFADGDAGEGASGTTGQQDGQGSAGAANTDQGDSQGTDGRNGQQGDAQGQDDQRTDAQKVEDLPDWAQREIRDLRKENGDRRTKLTAAETAQRDALRALAKAAGIDLPGEEEAPDPAELTTALTAAQQEARTIKVENAILRNASKHGASPDKLTDSRAFMATVDKLDPAADDFATKLDSAIKDAVTKNPMLKAQAAGTSSADHAGGSGEGRNRTPKSLHEAVGSAYGTA